MNILIPSGLSNSHSLASITLIILALKLWNLIWCNYWETLKLGKCLSTNVSLSLTEYKECQEINFYLMTSLQFQNGYIQPWVNISGQYHV